MKTILPIMVLLISFNAFAAEPSAQYIDNLPQKSSIQSTNKHDRSLSDVSRASYRKPYEYHKSPSTKYTKTSLTNIRNIVEQSKNIQRDYRPSQVDSKKDNKRKDTGR